MTEEIIPQRTCTKCGKSKPLTAFYKHARGPSGYRWDCKECANKQTRTYVETNERQIRGYQHQYRKQHLGAVREYNQQYYQQNKSAVQAGNKAWYEANKQRHRAANRAWGEQFPEQLRVIRNKYKANKRNMVGACTSEQWIARCEYYGWRCYLCGCELTHDTLQMEHRIPVCRGGTHWPSNLAPACGPCNNAKDKKTENEYRHGRFSKMISLD